jgi:ribosomal protein L37E
MLFTAGFFIETFVLIYLVITYFIKKKKEIRQKWVEYDHRRFILAETKLIEIAKWIEGEHIHKDPGATEEERNAFMEKWIMDHASGVRSAWNDSRCRICGKECFYNMKKECPDFFENKRIISWQNGKQLKCGNARSVVTLNLISRLTAHNVRSR